MDVVDKKCANLVKLGNKALIILVICKPMNALKIQKRDVAIISLQELNRIGTIKTVVLTLAHTIQKQMTAQVKLFQKNVNKKRPFGNEGLFKYRVWF